MNTFSFNDHKIAVVIPCYRVKEKILDLVREINKDITRIFSSSIIVIAIHPHTEPFSKQVIK
jgi:hypothetical protein